MSSAPKPIVVTIDDAHLDAIHQVAERLGERGMTVERILPITGVVSGTCGPERMEALRDVDGVSAIEDDATVQLPPHGAPGV
jgi:hypothetical protein